MIVLDCCAAMEIVQGTERGRALQGLFLSGEEVVAPAYFPIEVANASWKFAHAHRKSGEETKRLMDDALSLPDRLVPVDDMLDEAFAESVALDHNVYDMLYLVLARRYAATLATCDNALRGCCRKRDVNCIAEIGF